MNIAIAQSGGPTCAINASLVGVFKQGNSVFDLLAARIVIQVSRIALPFVAEKQACQKAGKGFHVCRGGD